MLLSLGVIFTLRFFGLGETKPAIVTELRPNYRLVYVAPDPIPLIGWYSHNFDSHDFSHAYQEQPQPIISASEHSPQPILSNRVTDEDVSEVSAEGSPSAEGYEVSQFHSEDENGKVVFGFRSPDQARMEARDMDGTVRGMYSYVDALGNIIKMQYWDDGHGMHMAGNNLPIANYQTPEFTPEVRAAREEHFRLYEAALEALKAAGLEVEGHELEEEDDIHVALAPPASSSSNEHDSEGPAFHPLSDEEEDFDQSIHDPVIIENESVEKDPINKDEHQPEEEYPKYEYTPHHAVSPVHHDDNEDKESVAVENPEIRSMDRDNWRRQGKSQQLSPSEAKKSISQAKSSEQMSEIQGKLQDTLHTASESSLTKEQVIDLPGGGKTFFYHFTHVIPKPVERTGDANLKSSGSSDAQKPQQHLNSQA